MKEFLVFLLGVSCFLGGIYTAQGVKDNQVESLKQECERHLPRSQECVMAFIAPDGSVVTRSPLEVGNGTTN
jgi:hypothetical protein